MTPPDTVQTSPPLSVIEVADGMVVPSGDAIGESPIRSPGVGAARTGPTSRAPRTAPAVSAVAPRKTLLDMLRSFILSLHRLIPDDICAIACAPQECTDAAMPSRAREKRLTLHRAATSLTAPRDMAAHHLLERWSSAS